MKNYPKKSFFKERTKAQILKLDLQHADSNFDGIIHNFDENNQGLIIEKQLIPEQFYYINDEDQETSRRQSSRTASRKFLKHGPEVELKKFNEVESVSKIKYIPVDLRRKAFNEITDFIFSGYSWIPFELVYQKKDDKRKRKVSLIECIEAAQIIYFGKHAFPEQAEHVDLLETKLKYFGKKVTLEGATVPVITPSRRKNISRYDFNLTSVPIVNSKEKLMIIYSLASEGYTAKDKQFSFQYKKFEDKTDSNLFRFFAHEIAAYFKIIEESLKLGNMIPMEMVPFAIPSQETIDYHKKIRNNLLIRDESYHTKDKLRKPYEADSEILHWLNVLNKKHDATFYTKKKLKNYNWK